MIEGVKVSACVDCATSIIGDRLRCPACHEQYGQKESFGRVAISWVVFAELLVVLVCCFILVTRGCM